uniref:Putative major capsid protein n=1 Tax=viral metagenome TaxID=1070528 RepID=A0A6H1ZBC9_9ZZZZ
MPFTALNFPIAASDPLGELAWSKIAHVETQHETFFAKAGMTAKAKGDEDAHRRKAGVPIILHDELKSEPGSEVRVRMRKQLTSTPRSAYGTITNYGTASMLGKEEPLNYYDMAVKLGLLKHAVGNDSPDFYQHYTSIDMEQDAEAALQEWLVENHEEAILDCLYEKYPYFIQQQLSASAVANTNLYYGEGATSQAELDQSMVFDANEAMRLRSFAVWKKLNPVKIDGKTCFIVLADTFVCTDLRQDAMFRELKDADSRGSDNPIVSGAIGVYQGLCIWEYQRMRTMTSGASAANIGRIGLLGADAIAVAYGSRPRIVPRVETAYGDRWGRAIRQVLGASRADFQESDDSATTQQSSAEWRVWRKAETFA